MHIVGTTLELLIKYCTWPTIEITGTGKTTVAMRVGALFKSLDLLSSADVVECSASDFGTGFAGQSAGKTRSIFESALGKTLFVDEAYR